MKHFWIAALLLASCASGSDVRREDLAGRTEPGAVVWIDYQGADAAGGAPAEITVGDGRTDPFEIVPCLVPVAFVNAGKDIHGLRARCELNDSINVVLRPGERVTRVFRLGERLRLECPLHGESFWIVAARHPYYAVADGAGRFVIPGAPVGRHTLHAWHEKRGERAVDVDNKGVEVALPY